MKRLVLLAAALAGLSAHVAVARAAPPRIAPELRPQLQAHLAQAKVAYNLGKFDEALRAYEAAYRLVPLPSLLFNIGQCHRQSQRPDRAVFFFEGYLREADPAPSQRAMVEELLTEARAEVDRSAEAAAKPAPAVVAKAEPEPEPDPKAKAKAEPSSPAREGAVTAAALPRAPSPPPPPPTVAASALTATAEVEDAGPAIYQRWWFWTLVGVGVVAAGTGAALALSGGGESAPPAGSLGTVDWR